MQIEKPDLRIIRRIPPRDFDHLLCLQLLAITGRNMMLSTYGTNERAQSPPTTVTWPTHTVSLEDKFHYAALSGKLSKIRDIFNRGISVDCYNEDGQTALFCAAFKGYSSVVALLLSLGAKPNARCNPGGYTPVHAACFVGCPQILRLILQAGGDLRLCDNQRRTPVCWCLLQSDPVKVQAIRNVIEGARICVTQTNGVEMLKERQNSLSPRNNRVFFETVRNMLKMSSKNRHDMNLNLEELATGIHYTGFGKVYFGSGQRCASVIGLPYISEVSELEDEKEKEVPSWICGKFTSFSPRQWTPRRTPVTTRELHKTAGPHCIPDILITELEVRSKLHHPNLLMLLGVCQTNKCDSVTLVFERVKIGSLYTILHTERKPLSSGFATDIVIQICEALEYVHSLGIVHCAVTSHAIMLVNSGQAKLTCFEYALPDDSYSEEFMSWRHPILTSDAHLGVLRHWMAPEVLLKQQFSVKGDVYSLASVMYELCTGEVPWRHFSLKALRQLFSQTQDKLKVNKRLAPHLWYHLLSLGLEVKRDIRDLELEEIRDMMVLSKKPQSVQCSEMGSLYGSRRASEAENIDNVDGVDVADYYGSDGKVYRKSTSYSSLPANHAGAGFLETTPPTGRRLCATEERQKPSKNVVKIPPTDVLIPPRHGILKFKVTKQCTLNKATCTTELDGPEETSNHLQDSQKVVQNVEKYVKETQTEMPHVEHLTPPSQEQQNKVEDPQVVDEPPKKPERIGAIMKLGLDCRKDNKNTGTQTEGRGGPITKSWYDAPKAQRLIASPSPGPSPNSASTPLWSSFNSSSTTSGPIDYVLDPETKAIHKKIKVELSRMLEKRQSGKEYHVGEPKKFYSLQLPKKMSAIKPASHFLEGVPSTAQSGSTEVWNYVPANTANIMVNIMSSAGDKCPSPAIKPAGHSLSVQSNGKMFAQKEKGDDGEGDQAGNVVQIFASTSQNICAGTSQSSCVDPIVSEDLVVVDKSSNGNESYIIQQGRASDDRGLNVPSVSEEIAANVDPIVSEDLVVPDRDKSSNGNESYIIQQGRASDDRGLNVPSVPDDIATNVDDLEEYEDDREAMPSDNNNDHVPTEQEVNKEQVDSKQEEIGTDEVGGNKTEEKNDEVDLYQTCLLPVSPAPPGQVQQDEEEWANGAAIGSKIHAQRKFAQGATVRNTGCSPLKLSKAGHKKKADKPISPTPCTPPLKRPKTEDFLAFLCYRSTPVLPQELDFFNYPQTDGTVENLNNDGTFQDDCRHKNEEQMDRDEVSSSTLGTVSRSSAVGPSTGPSTSSVAKTKEKSGGIPSKSNDKKNSKTSTLKKIPNVMVVVKQAEKAVAAMNKVKKEPPPNLTKPTRLNEQDARFAMTALTGMTALKLKYQEKRLNKPKSTASVVSKITKKVKGRNVILTRSKANSQGGEDIEKTSSPKPKAVSKTIVAKPRLQKDIRPRSRNAPSPDIIYGVIHSKNMAKKVSSRDSSPEQSSSKSGSSSDSSKSDNSSSSEEESDEEETPVVRSLRNGKQFVAQAKKPPVVKSTPTPTSRKKSTISARISTRSSHRKSTSPLCELPMYGVKKRKLKKANKNNSSSKKIKKSVESPKQKSKDEPNQISHRPTRKTKETASIYLGLINTFSSDEEEDNNGKNEDESGDSSSSETKYIEKQYNASIKRVEQNNQSANKTSKKSSSTATTTTKMKSKKDTNSTSKGGTGKTGKSSSKTSKVIPVKRILRSQSSGTKSLKAPLPRRIGTRRLTTPVANCDRRTEGAARKSATMFPKRRTRNISTSQSSPSSESENESEENDESEEDNKSNTGDSDNKSSIKKTQPSTTKGKVSTRKLTTKIPPVKTRANTKPNSSTMKTTGSSKQSNKSSKRSNSSESVDDEDDDEEEDEEEEEEDKLKDVKTANVKEDIAAVEVVVEMETQNSNGDSRVVEIHHVTPSTSPSSSSSNGENSDEDVTSSDEEPKPVVEKTSIAIQVDMDMEENIFEDNSSMNEMYSTTTLPMPPQSIQSSSQHNLTHTSTVNNFMPAISLSHPHPPPMPFASGPSFYPTLHLTPPVVSNIQLLARGAQEFSFNHPSITMNMNIPVSMPMHGYPGMNPLLQPSAMCFSSTSISAATLQTHIRSVAANLDIPLVRPIVGNLMNNAANCSTGMTTPLNFWSSNNNAARASAFRVPIPGSKPVQSTLMMNPNHSMLPLSIVHPQQIASSSSSSCVGQVSQLNNNTQQHNQRIGGIVPQSSTSGNTPSSWNVMDNISIVPRFNRNSKPVVLPDDQEALERQIKQSNKASHSNSSSKSSKGNEEKKDKESKRKKSFIIPKPTSPLTVRKDSTNPVTYVGINSKKGSKSSGSEKIKEPKADPFNKLLQMKKADTGKSSSSSSSTEMKASTPPPQSSSSSSSPLPVRPSSKESSTKSETYDARQVENVKVSDAQPEKETFPSAPTFYPDDEEFQNPLKYIEKIRAEAEHFGIARIVPPRSFRPDCNVDDGMRFTAYNHYIHKMFQRWGHNVHETIAIKEHLRKSDVDSSSVPMIGGMEIDLCTLYHTVQSFGGLKETIEKQKWNKISDAMHIPKAATKKASKLDSVYVKYVLPYEMLSDNERKRLLNKVERAWNARQEKLRKKAMNSDSESESDKDTEEDDCIIKGKSTPLSSYFRVARNTRSMLFQDKEPTCSEVEKEYWKIVSRRTRHLCVYSGSIDCGFLQQSWGFPLPKASNKHPWNLKVLANNSGSVLRSMGPVMGATVPTLHVGMIFTTYCWYRDPHGLPWVEYLHSGGNKIWYAIPASDQDKFREAVKELMPLQCKNKKIWLASDSAMVPPELLQERGISLCRAVQNPGEFLVVFPKAFTSAICTSYVISESVCFAPPEWLSTAPETFNDIKTSKEPPVFPIERLFLSIIQDSKSSSDVLRRVIDPVEKILREEFASRKKLIQMGIQTGSLVTKPNTEKTTKKKEKKEDEVQQCDNCNYILHLSLVNNEANFFTYCLPHAIEYLLKHKSHVKTSVLRFDRSQEELEKLVEEVVNRLS